MAPTSKHTFVVCAALVATSSGEKTLEENDGSGLLQMQSPLATRRQQHTAATQLLQTAHAIIKKVNDGDDPADCSEASGAAREAVEAALPAIAEQHIHLTNQILIAGNVVDACATQEIDGLDMVTQQGTNLQTERSNHAICRQTENELEGGLGACDQFEELRNSLGNQQCFTLPGEDGWILAVQIARDAMETALNQGQPLEESCTNARVALAAQQTECATAQHRFEEDYCAHRASCTELQICRANAEENYGLVVVEVQAALEVLHSEYQVMKHVECLLGMTDDALAQNSIISQEVIGSCSEPASTDELTIDYPVFSSLTTCESTILTRWPCDSVFFEAEYQSLAQRETIETACTECSALSVEPQWNLIMKSNGDETLGWSSSYWTDSVLLNEQSPVAEAGNAKYAAFNDAPFTQIRLCIDTPEDNCFEHTVASRYTSAQSLFSAGYIADDTFDRDDLVEVIGTLEKSSGQSYELRDCPMEKPGFNTECPDSNKARFGFCLNMISQQCQDDPLDPTDSDAVLGIGLSGQESREVGAGVSGLVYADADGSMGKNVWVWVKDP